LNLSEAIALRTPHCIIPLKMSDTRCTTPFTTDLPKVRSRCIRAVKMGYRTHSDLPALNSKVRNFQIFIGIAKQSKN
jgi:hypothetical protein